MKLLQRKYDSVVRCVLSSTASVVNSTASSAVGSLLGSHVETAAIGAEHVQQMSLEGGQSTIEESSARVPLDWRAVWSITSMSLGAGVFLIPSCFVELGTLHACFWIIAFGCVACIAQELLIDSACDTDTPSYDLLAELAFGAGGRVMLEILTLVSTFIASASYISAAAEMFKSILAAFVMDVDVNTLPEGTEVFNKTKGFAILLLQFAVVVPYCFARTLGAQAGVSKMGVLVIGSSSVFFTGYCVYLLCYGCGVAGASCGNAPPLAVFAIGSTLRNCATIAFSYSMVFAVFPVLQERLVATGDRRSVQAAAVGLKAVVRTSCAMCCSIYLVIGMLGAVTLGTATKPLALNNFSMLQLAPQVVNLMVAVTCTLLVAVISFPCLQVLDKRVVMIWGEDRAERARPILVVAFGAALVTVDAFVPTKVAFALAGSLGLSAAAYIMPGLIFLRMSRHRGRRSVALAATVVVFGAGLLLGATPATLASALASHGAVGPDLMLV